MDYIEICEWNKFQHYKKRNPPWIKLYASILDDDDFDCLQDDSKLLFFCLLPFASRRNNKMLIDFPWLQKKLPINKKITQKTLQPLVNAGFIACYQDDSNVIAPCKQDAMPEKRRDRAKTETETETEHLSIFDSARELFGGTKRGNPTEFENFQKHTDWKEVLPLLLPAIEKQIEWRKNAGGEFRPPWKNFQTWINNRCWEEEPAVDQKERRVHPVVKCANCGDRGKWGTRVGFKVYCSTECKRKGEGW